MKKKLFLVFTVISLLGLLCACSSKNGNSTGNDEINPTQGTEQAVTSDAAKDPEITKSADNDNAAEPAPTKAQESTDSPEEVLPDVNPTLPGAASAKASTDGLWTGMTAAEIVAKMGVGFNLGNTFDATGGKGGLNIYAQETSWGNPKVTYEQIKTVADAGFKTIRIPITWMNHINVGNNYTVNDKWLERVREVVDYAYDCGLVVIINAHHEDWINKKDLDKEYMSTGEELAALWMQIADYFADYDQHLVFEVMNEPRCVGTATEWTGHENAYKAINYLNSVAVNAIRTSHKGYNDERAIMIPDYAAQSSYICMMWLEIPKVDGVEATNIIASIHGYTPYNFCLQDTQVDFDLDNTSHTKPIDDMFESIYKRFVSKGIPAVLGETGATNTKDNLTARENWAWYISKKGAEYGIPVVLWDNGSTGKSGGECHAYLARRKPGEWYFPTIIENFVGGAAGAEQKFSDIADSDGNDKASSSDTSVAAEIWSNADGLTSTSEWNMEYIQNLSYPDYYPEGGEILVVYTGNGEPKLMMDSEVKEQWWMPMDAEWVESVDGKNIAHFSVEGARELIASYGVESFAELRNLCVLATNGSITTYEVKAVK